MTALPTFTESTTIAARLTPAKWFAVIAVVVGISLAAYKGYRDIIEEQRSLRADRAADRQANTELASSLRDLGNTITALQGTVRELQGEVRAMRAGRTGP